VIYANNYKKFPMRSIFNFCVLIFYAIVNSIMAGSSTLPYQWLKDYNSARGIEKRIPVPDGFGRVDAPAGSFEDWLRHLPLKQGVPPVYLHNGQLKANQSAHFAVVDIDVGSGDLQQCADAIIRLRAEYLYSIGDFNAIHFKFTSGHNAEYARWREGYRPIVGKGVRWVKSARPDYSYENFRRYLISVFRYAGTYSLSREMQPISDIIQMKIGDVFIKGGFPGHAVLVVDMALNKQTGKKAFILLQSYMPAQDMHILKNPTALSATPWYELDFGETLYTPEWVFSREELKRF